jgi:hypothetical protein
MGLPVSLRLLVALLDDLPQRGNNGRYWIYRVVVGR